MERLRHNADPTAGEMYSIALDALKEAKMAPGRERKKQLVASAKAIYDETQKFPKAHVPSGLNRFHYTGKIDIDELAKMFKLPAWDVVEERNSDYIWETADYAVGNAMYETTEEIEAIRDKAEQEVRDEMFGQWHNGVSAAADRMFANHDLVLSPIGKTKWPWQFKIGPETSWEVAAEKILNTINGVGYFHFATLKEFLLSGPYETPRIAVLAHLHWMVRYPEVFGDNSAQTIYERSFR